MSALDYDGLGNMLLATLVRQQPTGTPPVFDLDNAEPFFATLYPEAIRYAEGRIYKECVFLATRTQNYSLQTVPNVQFLDLTGMVQVATPNPQPVVMVVVEQFGILTPFGANSPSTGVGTTLVPYVKTSLEAVQMLSPDFYLGIIPDPTDFNPRLWAPVDDHTITFCPNPNAPYATFITGLVQQAPLSETNTETYITRIYPELMEAACMVFLTGALLKNFGAQSGNPQMGLSWEAETAKLMTLANNEEMRRRGLRPDIATPARQV